MNKAQQQQEKEIAQKQLETYLPDLLSQSAVVVVVGDYGKSLTDYFRVFVFWHELEQVQNIEITWSLAKASGYRLRDRGGRWFIAISGGGYSKPLELKLALEHALGISNVRYETI